MIGKEFLRYFCQNLNLTCVASAELWRVVSFTRCALANAHRSHLWAPQKAFGALHTPLAFTYCQPVCRMQIQDLICLTYMLISPFPSSKTLFVQRTFFGICPAENIFSICMSMHLHSVCVRVLTSTVCVCVSVCAFA